MLGRLMWLQGRRTGGFVVVVVVEEGQVHLLLLLILGRTRRTGRFVVVIIGEEEEGVPSQCTLGSALSKSNFELFLSMVYICSMQKSALTKAPFNLV